MVSSIKIQDLPAVFKQYRDLIGDHTIIKDQTGTYRFKGNAFTRYVADQLNMSRVWLDYQSGKFTKEDFMQFYRDLGYTLQEFIDVWANVK